MKAVDHRDEDILGLPLLDIEAQGFNPDYTIADRGKGLRAGQKAALPNTPCHGDIFHILQQFEKLANSLARQAQGAKIQRLKLEEMIAKARLNNKVSRSMTAKLVHAIRQGRKSTSLAQDIKTLMQCLSHDVLELVEPTLIVRLELFDFIKAEIQR